MIINKNEELIKLCKALEKEAFFTLDTEFIRERTYYSKLCLIQVATEEIRAIIDPLADIDLTPFFELLQNPKVLKILHSSRQDIEIFYNLTGKIPTPIYDTQITAMVFGFGESVGYGKLVQHYFGKELDKSSRLTDWAKRPLTERQVQYAISDVTYLVDIYHNLKKQTFELNRQEWVAEELKSITNPKLYKPSPDTAWQKLKEKPRDEKKLATLKALAKWRELKAMELDRPRRHIISDPVLVEIAKLYPEQQNNISQIRGMKYSGEIFNVLKNLPKVKEEKSKHSENPKRNIVSMLNILLRIQCEKHNVATKLVANKGDVAKISRGETDTHTLNGWRYDVFGKYAVQLVNGQIGFKIEDGELVIYPL